MYIYTKYQNRLSITIGGNRERDQLYTTSQVSNIKEILTCFPRLYKKCKTETKEHIKLHNCFTLRSKII